MLLRNMAKKIGIICEHPLQKDVQKLITAWAEYYYRADASTVPSAYKKKRASAHFLTGPKRDDPLFSDNSGRDHKET
jgi:hypothetical protein